MNTEDILNLCLISVWRFVYISLLPVTVLSIYVCITLRTYYHLIGGTEAIPHLFLSHLKAPPSFLHF